ncbi:pyrroline-5-carboxylate reductase [Methylococcus geothermalis]|uniref:Pyrroline-5-carboxylate reductase n=1 Tax=Methylococcus geothermalis TaxID=2681310 RepID=A0A858Q7I3_9GAMM|nr:pyrroline-5-carboxylate reductase [Methylococcus geothermalis]QJD29862.1 pyrroline-5-carboxylate reductase [Methylococcus geothermalis]
MKHKALGFIGAGNMASSLVGGLVADGYPARNIWVSDVDEAKLDALSLKFGVNVTGDNRRIAGLAEILVLAVKPQILRGVAEGMADVVGGTRPLVLSIAAGVGEAAIDRWLGGGHAVVRCMPNTPALVKTSATALHANDKTTAAQRSEAESILRAVGLTVWVEREEALDAVTAISGSGPAYFFLLMEALENAAAGLGLDPETARLLVQQTALGAARIAMESEEGPAQLRHRVTSPNGTTECAVGIFESRGLRDIVAEAVSAAHGRAIQMARELGAE